MEPEYDTTRRDILESRICSATSVWKLPKSNSGKIMAACGRHLCGAVVWSATIEGVTRMLLGYRRRWGSLST